jgi:hypothetical protein
MILAEPSAGLEAHVPDDHQQSQPAELRRQHSDVGWCARPEGEHEGKRADDDRRSDAVQQGAAQRHACRSRINSKHKEGEERPAGLGAEKIEQSGDREIEEGQPGEGETIGSRLRSRSWSRL